MKPIHYALIAIAGIVIYMYVFTCKEDGKPCKTRWEKLTYRPEPK